MADAVRKLNSIVNELDGLIPHFTRDLTVFSKTKWALKKKPLMTLFERMDDAVNGVQKSLGLVQRSVVYTRQ